MLSRSLRIARLGGVDVKVDAGWVLLAILVAGSFQVEFSLAGRDLATTALMAVTATVLFFASLLAHELAHAMEGLHRDIEVHGITLMIFGGVTEMGRSPRRPRDEFAISAVGPYVSLVAGAFFGIVATFTDALGGPAAVAEVAGTLGWLNLLLAVFNLIPGAPLDGGRVLRSAIWAATRDRHRAIRWASYAGQVVAALLVLYALRVFLVRPEAFLAALWPAAIGWFMWQAARAERQHAEIEELLDGRTMAALTGLELPHLPTDRTLDTVTDRVAAAPGIEVFPVVDPEGRVIGALHLKDVMEIDPHDRPFRTVADLMRPIEHLRTVPESTPILEVAAGMSEGAAVVVVDEDGHARALVTPNQLQAALDRWHALARRREHHRPDRRQDERL